ncbi:hypothetical protein AVEN_203216-1 [Araneus ventricosus]|uniref:Uncharacterized protein n=1 Tax=Araneus ventricosus TaxID=182803 RepID=A0A4Y2F3E6_ARAVE|nr:hypothetical protein AVEN_203216-1 [Araneus ventricosus]
MNPGISSLFPSSFLHEDIESVNHTDGVNRDPLRPEDKEPQLNVLQNFLSCHLGLKTLRKLEQEIVSMLIQGDTLFGGSNFFIYENNFPVRSKVMAFWPSPVVWSS